MRLVPRLLPLVALALTAGLLSPPAAAVLGPSPDTPVRAAVEAVSENATVSVVLRPASGFGVLSGRSVDELDGVDVTGTIDQAGLIRAEVTPDGHAALVRSGLTDAVVVDQPMELFLDESTAVVEADAAVAAGRDGSGKVVAVIDSGVDATHPALTGRVVAEACFLVGVRGTCPTGGARSTEPGAAEPCAVPALDCAHGTHVAGIVAGAETPYEGVAPGAGIVAIRVMRGGFVDGTAIASSDVIEALDHVLTLKRAGTPISVVNLSLGGGPSSCTDPTTIDLWGGLIDDLLADGVVVVAASGNSADEPGSPVLDVAFPACLDNVVSVGATERDDTVGLASENAPEVTGFTQYVGGIDLLAPGYEIESAVPGDTYATLSGTSMAAPHVAGAYALVAGSQLGWSPERYVQLLRTTGEMIERPTEADGDRHQRYPEIRLVDALAFDPFDDAISGFWVIAADWAKYAGVSTGPGGDLFDPDATLTRAEAVTFLWRLMGEPEPAGSSGFSDVPEGEWYSDAVAWAAQSGVTTGTGGGLFEPDESVTRAQMATFLWRVVGAPPFFGPSGFVDVPEGEFYSQAVAWMAANEITTGTSPTEFSPDDIVTRAQMVTFLWRLVNRVEAWSGDVAPPERALF